ncbi:MAG: hypothetical protein WA980_03220 [Shinella zoogloeoides]|uniref:hypothetical protein n=1 Tax=Shinella zoogloeoides TaxID=352475 RepID=UPI003C75D0F6
MDRLRDYFLSVLIFFLIAFVFFRSDLSYSQVTGPAPDETVRDYNKRYGECNVIADKFGYTPEGFWPHWNQCMRDLYARAHRRPAKSPTLQKKKPSPSQKKVHTQPGETQDAGNLTDTAKVDPVWANDTRQRVAREVSASEVKEPVKMDDYAPYGDPKCAVFKPAPHRGAIDWDWVKVTNRCSYPIGVLFCYYDVGQERDCLPGGKGSWGLGHIAPGKTDTSVATSQRMPWMVKAIVCNMTPIEHNRMLCVLPDSYKKP